ncbi:MAG TPA: hypothetical protein DCX00_08655 [Flavobacteriales bacterium]|nr:hypothetical protein [Flavobacteriales bacterium]
MAVQSYVFFIWAGSVFCGFYGCVFVLRFIIGELTVMISTTRLGESMGWSSKETFLILVEWGLIKKEDGLWVPTDKGRKEGAKMTEHPQYGQQLRWATGTNLNSFQKRMMKDLLTATTIGEHFDVSGQKVNKILAELGWVEQDVQGWIVTELGRAKGGQNLEATSGKLYAKWGSQVLEDPGMLGWLRPKTEAELSEDSTIEEPDVEGGAVSARERLNKRFPPKIITQDGHRVRSLGEKTIDDWLYMNKIVHAYERPFVTSHGDLVPDFYIPAGVSPGSHAVYIEYWGMEGKAEYDERKQKKLAIYGANNLLGQLIELNRTHHSDLESELAKQLLKKAKLAVV